MNENTIKDHIGVGMTIRVNIGGVVRGATIVEVAAGPQWTDIESLASGNPITGDLLNVTLSYDDEASRLRRTHTVTTNGDAFVAWCHKQRYGA